MLPQEPGDTSAEAPDDGSRSGAHETSEEEVDEASDESFPASDSPQWWSGSDEGREEPS